MRIKSTYQLKHKKTKKDNKAQSSYKRNTYIIKKINGYYGLVLLIVKKISIKCRRKKIITAKKF